MRWVKHLSMAHADAELDAAMEKHGAIVYAVYWLIVEDIASQMDPSRPHPSASHSVQRWSQICRVDPRVFRNCTQTLSKKLISLSTVEDNRIIITVPNILKYKDEWSRKSGATQDLNRTEESRVEQKRTEPEKKAPSEPKKAVAKAPLTPAILIAELQALPVYSTLDVQHEYDKHVAWCGANHRQPTKRGFVNWLNRADAPLFSNGHRPPSKSEAKQEEVMRRFTKIMIDKGTMPHA